MTTKQEALDDIRAMAGDDGSVSRSKYREEGRFSTWEIDTLFGNFTEFKRQAGLMLTRHQNQLQGQVARFVSMDEMRKLNIDRADYGTKYEKPSGKRFQTIMVASDLHDKEMDPFWRRVFLDTVRRVKPDIVCLGGDLFDLPEFGKYPVDPRTWDVVGRIAFVHGFLAELREAAGDAQIDLIEGNHEFRLLRHLGEATPALKAVLSDLHGMTVGQLLGLDKFHVRYIARGDLGVWTKGDMNKQIGRNYQVYFDTLLVDHFPSGIRKGLSGFNGHHHKFEVTSFYSHLRGPSMWMQLGCGHHLAAEYCDGEMWNMGFAISHVDTEANRVQMNYIPVADFAEVGGTFYMRESSEH